MKAVITTGGKQYVVQKDDVLEVELVGDDKTVSFEPLMIITDKATKVGTPTVEGSTVKAKVLEPDYKGDKVKIQKFQAKKRVSTLTGHRQRHSKIQITSIS